MADFVFFGTSDFAVIILDTLKKHAWLPKLVVTTPDKLGGRGLKLRLPPVKVWAEKNNIPYLQPENLNSPELRLILSKTRFLTAIVASYGKIIPQVILDVFSKGILNAHPSLLPLWRGADPIRAVILAGDKKTGVSIMLMDEKMDHGPILKSRILDLESRKYNYTELKKELAELGGKLLVEIIPKWLAGEITPKEQDHELATYTKKITKGDGHIDWSKSAEIIERKIRALNPWPGTYAFWKGVRIKIIEAMSVSELGSDSEPSSDIKPGIVFKRNSEMAVACKDGFILIKKIQLEGKKSQNAKDFLNGYPDIVGVILN